MTTHTEPAVFAQQIRAASDDIPKVAEYVTARLREAGWTVSPPVHYANWRGTGRPAWAMDALNTPESARFVLTPAQGRHMQLPNQYSLGALADLAPNGSTGLVQHMVSSLPLTDYEFDSIASEMPLTAAIAERVHAWIPSLHPQQTRPLAGYGAIFTIHHQTDFLLLLERALALGIERELVTVIDKQYQYRIGSRVDATIKDRFDIKVFPFDQLTSGISDHVRRVDRRQRSAQSENWMPTVVLDDGGYVLPELHRNFESYLNLFHGVVEQTQSGIWALRPYEALLRVPVFSVAESDLKRTVEAHGVAMAAITNLRNLLPNEKFTGRRALVVGYGRLGKALADVLRAMHFQVSVAETSSATRVRGQEEGYDCRSSTADLIKEKAPHFIFACGGRGCIGRAEIDAVTGDVFVISLTSRDYAVDKEYLASLSTNRTHGTIGRIYSMRNSQVEVFLVADGFPVNFHHSESMPNRQSDLVMASLLVGAVHLCTGTPPWPPGNDVTRANFSLNEGSLLEDFYNA